jgi:hypothetical protein
MARSTRASTPTAKARRGKFYLWSPEEARSLLSADEYAVVAPHLGLDAPPNFEGHAWNLRVTAALDDVAQRLGIALPDAQFRLFAGKAALFAARERRVRPGLDDKVLTSWNALAIAGLARAARALDEPRWADLAIAAVDALRASVWREGRLLATRRAERAQLNAYLDDHAFLLDALIELLQTRFRGEDFAWARQIADVSWTSSRIARTADSFSRATITSGLSTGPKPGHDNATPSGNGVAAQALILLGTCAPCRASGRGGRARRASGSGPRWHIAGGLCRLILAALAELGTPPTSCCCGGTRRRLRGTGSGRSKRGCDHACTVFNVDWRGLAAELVKGPAPPPARGPGLSRHALRCRPAPRRTRSKPLSQPLGKAVNGRPRGALKERVVSSDV